MNEYLKWKDADWEIRDDASHRQTGRQNDQDEFRKNDVNVYYKYDDDVSQ
jgi:hypothetical protein